MLVDCPRLCLTPVLKKNLIVAVNQIVITDLVLICRNERCSVKRVTGAWRRGAAMTLKLDDESEVGNVPLKSSPDTSMLVRFPHYAPEKKTITHPFLRIFLYMKSWTGFLSFHQCLSLQRHGWTVFIITLSSQSHHCLLFHHPSPTDDACHLQINVNVTWTIA